MTDTSATVTVAADDSLDDVIRRLRDAGNRPLDLVVPVDSALLLTAAEFRALKDATDRGRLAVTIRTADPLRLQLARLLGVDAAPLPVRPQPAPPPVPLPPDPASVKQAPRRAPRAAPPPSAPPPTTNGAAIDAQPVAWPTPLPQPDIPPPPPPRPLVVIKLPALSRPRRTKLLATPIDHPPSVPGSIEDPSSRPDQTQLPDRGPASAVPAAAEPLPPASVDLPAAAVAGGETLPLGSAASPVPDSPPADQPDGLGPVAAVEEENAPAAEREIQLSARALAIAGGALLTLLLIAAVVAAIRLPSATVDITLKQQPVQTELLYDVTLDGTPLDSTVELVAAAAPITTEIVFESILATTGRRLEPDQPATGSVRLANTAPTDIAVTAGTIVVTEEGVEFAFVEDVTVPAGNDDNDGKGTATGTVRAALPGSGGNVAIGAIGGRLPNGVYYTNRDAATTGGSDREVTVVAEEDIESLQDLADTALPDFVRQQLAQPLTDGSLVLPATIEIGDGREEFDHAAGEIADNVRLRVVATVSAMAYRPDEITARATEVVRQRLAAQAPAGYALDVDAVALYPAAVFEERDGGTRFRLVAEGRFVAVLDEAARQALVDSLAGADPARAAAIVRSLPQVDRFAITYHPAWFPDRMPGDAKRVTVNLVE